MGALPGCPVPPVVSDAGPRGEGEGEASEGEGDIGVGCVADDDTGFRAPADVTNALGSGGTLDIGTWNLAHFGNPDESGPLQTELAADIIASLELDLIGVQEIEDVDEWNELLARLPNHEGVLSASTGNEAGFDQRTGFIYRCGPLTPGRAVQLFNGNFNFPRAPLQVDFHFDDGSASFDFIAIVVHFKAFSDFESSERRKEAFVLLQTYVDSLVNAESGNENVIILGDFNERLDDVTGGRNWAPFLDGTRYVVRTQPLVDRGEASFISGGGAILDHLITTRGFDDEAGAATISIPRVDTEVPNYRDDVSDHRPVALILRGF